MEGACSGAGRMISLGWRPSPESSSRIDDALALAAWLGRDDVAERLERPRVLVHHSQKHSMNLLKF